MKCLVSTLLVLLCFKLSAQDTHYWTQQYGTRSSLLGGAVVGSVTDNSAIFYNPACLAFIDTSSVSVNANLYQFERTRIEDALGRQIDFKNNTFKSLPLLFSGLIPTRTKGMTIGYGVSSSVDYTFKGVVRLDDHFPVVDDTESPGDESIVAQLSLGSRISETVFGVGLGKKLNERWAIGGTILFNWRYHNYERNFLTRLVLNTSPTSFITSNDIETFTYNNLRAQGKFSLYYRGSHFDAGLSVNTPSVRLFGSGTVAADITATNILFQGRRMDIVANDRQAKLRSVFKSPWSLALGINFDLKRSRLGITGQYFGPRKIYNILQAEPATFVRPSEAFPNIGSDDFLRVKTGNKSVVNWAVGYEYVLSPRFTIDASFRVDNSYYDSDLQNVRGITPDISAWDIYHLVLGGSARGRRFSLNAGILLGFGSSKQYVHEGQPEQVTEGNLLLGRNVITRAGYTSIGVLLGFTIQFPGKDEE